MHQDIWIYVRIETLIYHKSSLGLLRNIKIDYAILHWEVRMYANLIDSFLPVIKYLKNK